MDSIIQRFAEYFSRVTFEDLSPEVVHKTKMLTIDLLGVTLAGLKMDFPQMMIDYLAGLEGVQQATLFGSKNKVPAIHAALGNGVSSHALDMDDGYRYGGVHAGVAVIPAALAFGESRNLDGKKFLLAMTMGYEIVNRISKAMNPSHLGRGFHTTGTIGVLGAAAACGVLAGLDKQQMANALSIAALQGAGLLEILNDGAMVKPIHPGKAAMAGVMSVELAMRGAKGPMKALEGEKGLFKAMADGVSTEQLFDGLGSDFYILGQYIKFHAACRHIHPTIDGLLSVMRDKQLKFQDLDTIDITTYPVAVSFCGAKELPDSPEGAKFSLAFSSAMAAYFGDAGEHRYTQDTVTNQEIRALASRISSSTSERWEKAYPRERGAALSIRIKTGETLTIDVPLPNGEPENPASDDDFIRKFQQNVADLNPAGVETLLGIVLNLDQHSIGELTHAMEQILRKD